MSPGVERCRKVNCFCDTKMAQDRVVRGDPYPTTSSSVKLGRPQSTESKRRFLLAPQSGRVSNFCSVKRGPIEPFQLLSDQWHPRKTGTPIQTGLRHSREMTILCSPKVTQHHPEKVAPFAVSRGAFLPVGKSRAHLAQARRRMIGFTAQAGSDADRVLYTLFAWMTERQTARLRVDDIACPSSCPAANRVLRVGHFKRAELGHFCRAPRRQGANSLI